MPGTGTRRGWSIALSSGRVPVPGIGVRLFHVVDLLIGYVFAGGARGRRPVALAPRLAGLSPDTTPGWAGRHRRYGWPHLETQAGHIPVGSLQCELHGMQSTEGRTTMSASKISIALAATALLISVLFATPIGQAAGNFVLAKNSVGAAQIKKNAVNGLKVKNGTLMAADFKAGQIPAGPQGAKGDPGAQGQKGDPGISGYQLVESSGPVLMPGQQGSATASCPAGKKAIGGGVGSDARLEIIESVPINAGQDWRVSVVNVANGGSGVSAVAVCGTVTS